MSVIKKTISIPEDVYKEAREFSENFSQIVKEALEDYLKKKKKEKILSMAGSLKDWEIKEGLEYENKAREEDIRTQKEREKEWDT
ncbi:type II toxin-antitoxin system CcdA family antitoxin [Persephonella sp. KM09-Lau-8]|uniref:type II toxin-antitoxin system CcdA family antitoxin n=1 Tax=Persephonella sp. KM09-Lau-8 TaxID=1158345 RepID=UPI000497315C|nr:type II toxin-antitoxin system CcdA family antitoxin [Persephonella sp. KM09-Lau-8]